MSEHHIGQQYLIWLNSSGFLRASCRLVRYLMWLEQLQILELKMQSREQHLKNKLLIILRHLQQGSTVHSLLRSAMVLMVFFSDLIMALKLLRGILFSLSKGRIFFSFFSINDIIPLPKFLGMFLVSFLSRLSYLRFSQRNQELYEGLKSQLYSDDKEIEGISSAEPSSKQSLGIFQGSSSGWELWGSLLRDKKVCSCEACM